MNAVVSAVAVGIVLVTNNLFSTSVGETTAAPPPPRALSYLHPRHPEPGYIREEETIFVLFLSRTSRLCAGTNEGLVGKARRAFTSLVISRIATRRMLSSLTRPFPSLLLFSPRPHTHKRVRAPSPLHLPFPSLTFGARRPTSIGESRTPRRR